MKYAVDRIENNIAVCEDLKSREIVNISLDLLPQEIKESDIIIYKDNKYTLDNNEKEIRLNRIEEKMKNLKRK